MRTLLLLVLWTATLSAEPAGTAVYVDISGPWRFTWGDDPRFADPDFDDSSWAEVLRPMGPHPRHRAGHDYRWFRRAVALPDLAREARLAITTGTLPGAIEVWVDGERIGRSSEFVISKIPFPRPKTFEFSNGNRG